MLPINLAMHGIIKLETLNECQSGGRKDVNIEQKMEWEYEEIDFDMVEEEEEQQEEDDEFEIVEYLIEARFNYELEPLIGQVISDQPAKTANLDYESRAIFNSNDYE